MIQYLNKVCQLYLSNTNLSMRHCINCRQAQLGADLAKVVHWHMDDRGHTAHPGSRGGDMKTRGATSVSVTIDHILAAFDEAGMRNTRPRRLIAERLATCAARGVDFTGDDLWHELLDIEPSLGRATVFRAIETLVNLKLLDRVTFADGTHRYRVCSAAHHHHLTCVRCHRVVEIETCLPMEQFHAIASRNDFALEGHALELYGRCAECREAAPEAS